ncbi:MAG: metallophosphoesterase [Longimicrobiaceae bacterium]
MNLADLADEPRRIAKHSKNPYAKGFLILLSFVMQWCAFRPPAPLQSEERQGETSREDGRPRGGVVIAQISDPHLFEDPKRPATFAAEERENQRAFTQALEFLGSPTVRAGGNPAALVITGDLGLDPGFAARRPATAGPLTRQQQVDLVANLLRRSPVKKVFVVAGNNDLTDERADTAELQHFHGFIDSVATRLAGSGVTLRDLTACYARSAAPPSDCYADLPGGIRLVGFSSATFKNAPRVDRKLFEYAVAERAAVAGASRAFDLSVVDRFATLVAQATRDGKRVLVLTHEPDLDDPWAVGMLRDSLRTYPDSGYDAGVWNVDSAVRRRWVAAASRPGVVAVLAGHFHSGRAESYSQPYAYSGTANRASVERLFVSPPLAVKNQAPLPTQARGLSLYRIDGGNVQREIAWYRGDSGFSATQPDTAASGVAVRPNAAPAASLPRIQHLTRSDRMGIVIFAIIAATGGLLAALKRALRDYRRNAQYGVPLDWREHLGVGWMLAWGLGGLILVLSLYSRDWSLDRGEIALWYAGAFAIWTTASALVLRIND